MAIWDSQGGGGDPMKMLLLASMAQGLGRSLSKSTNATYYGQEQSGGGMEEMLPQLMRAQQMQAQMANQQREYALEQQKFAASQEDAQRRRAGISQFAAQNGMSPEQAEAAWGELQKAIASRYETRTLGEKDEVYGPDGKLIAQNAADAEYRDGGVYDPATRQWSLIPEAQRALIQRAVAGKPVTSIHMPPAMKAMDEGVGKLVAPQLVDIYEAPVRAEAQEASYRKLFDLLDSAPDAQTGSMTETVMRAIKRELDTLGFNINEAEFATADAAQALANKLTFESMNTSTEDAGANPTDRDFMAKMKEQPGLLMSKEGRRLSLDFKVAERAWLQDRERAFTKAERELGRDMDPREIMRWQAEYSYAVPKYDKIAKTWGDRMVEKGGAPPPQQGAPAPSGNAGGLVVSPEANAIKQKYLQGGQPARPSPPIL